LFVVSNNTLVGSLSDGDIRRGYTSNKSSGLQNIMNENPCFLRSIDDFDARENIMAKGLYIVPVVDHSNSIIDIVNLRTDNYLPLDAFILAGGYGKRLHPLTENTPKPLIAINNRPIIDYLYEHLVKSGVNNMYISVNYLKNQIIDYFVKKENENIFFIEETEPLGTLGSITLVDNFRSNYILVANSDILSKFDLKDFFLKFKESNCDMGMLSKSFQIEIPYATLDVVDGCLQGFKEKPAFEYMINTGIYIIKKELLCRIPQNKFYNATDLMEDLIQQNKKIISFPFSGYWLDVGKHEDFEKAQTDINNIKF
jgi:NDP-sugar pyrophosphorylase family protein